MSSLPTVKETLWDEMQGPVVDNPSVLQHLDSTLILKP